MVSCYSSSLGFLQSGSQHTDDASCFDDYCFIQASIKRPPFRFFTHWGHRRNLFINATSRFSSSAKLLLDQTRTFCSVYIYTIIITIAFLVLGTHQCFYLSFRLYQNYIRVKHSRSTSIVSAFPASFHCTALHCAMNTDGIPLFTLLFFFTSDRTDVCFWICGTCISLTFCPSEFIRTPFCDSSRQISKKDTTFRTRCRTYWWLGFFSESRCFFQVQQSPFFWLKE